MGNTVVAFLYPCKTWRLEKVNLSQLFTGGVLV